MELQVGDRGEVFVDRVLWKKDADHLAELVPHLVRIDPGQLDCARSWACLAG